MSNFVLVIDKNRVPQNPMHPGESRLLLKAGKAAVLRLFPFVIVLKEAVEDAPIDPLVVKVKQPLLIQCVGHGNRQVCRTDKYGFPSRHKSRTNVHFGFQTGDIVKAVVTKGKKIGVHVGRVACRATGSFNISTPTGLMQGVSHRFCRLMHHKDGYACTQGSNCV